MIRYKPLPHHCLQLIPSADKPLPIPMLWSEYLIPPRYRVVSEFQNRYLHLLFLRVVIALKNQLHLLFPLWISFRFTPPIKRRNECLNVSHITIYLIYMVISTPSFKPITSIPQPSYLNSFILIFIQFTIVIYAAHLSILGSCLSDILSQNGTTFMLGSRVESSWINWIQVDEVGAKTKSCTTAQYILPCGYMVGNENEGGPFQFNHAVAPNVPNELMNSMLSE